MPGDLHQVGVAERVYHARHQAVVAPPVAEVEQLVIEVAGRFAGQAGVVAVGAGAALIPVAGGAGEHTLGHVVFETRRGLRAAAQAPGQQRQQQEGESGQPARHAEDHAKTRRAGRPGGCFTETLDEIAPYPASNGHRLLLKKECLGCDQAWPLAHASR